MKKLIALFTVTLLTVTSFGQVKEGQVKYKVDFSSSDPAIQAQTAMLAGSTLSMVFSPEFTRTEMSMGMFLNTTTIVSLKKGSALTLLSGMMGNKAIETSNVAALDAKEIDESMEIEKTTETKMVAGYNCIKYVVNTEDAVMNYWVTEELEAATTGVKYFAKGIKGFPLEFEVATNGMTMLFSATEVKKDLKGLKVKEIFSMAIPKDYDIMTEDQLKAMGM